MKVLDQYIPPMWIMCLESVAHLLVMINFSTNFLIYCSVSKQFKSVLSNVLAVCFPSLRAADTEHHQVRSALSQYFLSSILSVTCLCVTFSRFSSKLYDDGYERVS